MLYEVITPERLKNKLEQEGANVMTVEMLSGSIRTLEELNDLAVDDFAIFFEPPSIDDRIINQYAFCSYNFV